MLGPLKQSCFEFANTQVRWTLDSTSIKSQPTYVNEVWRPNSRKLSLKISEKCNTVDPLEKSWRTFLCLENLNLIPIVYEREQKDLIFYYKCKNNMIVLTCKSMLKLRQQGHGREPPSF